MYAISVLIKNSALSQSFYFKSFAEADKVYSAIFSSNLTLIIEDEYNSKGVFLISEIAAASLTDIKKDMEKQGDMEILRQKAMLRAQKFAQNDLGLGILQNGVSSPAILKGN